MTEDDIGREKPALRVVHSRPDPPTVPSEQAVMRYFTELNASWLRFNHDSERWLYWRKNRWHTDRTKFALAQVAKVCRDVSDTKTVNKGGFTKSVESLARAQREFATTSEDWDKDPMLLGTPRGVVELQTGTLRTATPEDMVSKTTLVTPTDEEACPRFKQFLTEALGGSDDDIAFLRRFAGYCLTALTREEMLLYIVGKPGTGKGTFTRTIITILGDYALTIPMTMFTTTGAGKAEYYIARFVGSRLALASEPGKGVVFNDALVNEMTGGDRLSGRHPAGRPFDFAPTHKLMLQGEQVPALKSISTGLRRRLGLLRFDVVPAHPDPTLKDYLRAEAPGILRWMINGTLDWLDMGLQPPPHVIEAVADYFADQDTISRWADACCDLLPTLRERPSVLLASYNRWATANFEDLLNNNTFRDAMRHRFRHSKIEGTNWYLGIALKP